ncbi:MAG: hypothetical protein ACREX3_21605 [Gammaproteobacteria bacterium]
MSLAETQQSAADLRDEMLAKAKKEGEFVIAGSHGREFTQELVGFRKKYPFLKMRGIASRGADTAARVVSESKAGKLSIDVMDSDDAELESLAKRAHAADGAAEALKGVTSLLRSAPGQRRTP